MQRPWGRAVPEETGVWLEHSKPRRRGKKRGHGGDGVGLAESCGLHEDLKSCSQSPWCIVSTQEVFVECEND